MRSVTPVLLGIATCLSSCRENEAPETPLSPDQMTAAAGSTAADGPALHLGFASRIRHDADLYFAGYGADRMVRRTLEALAASPLVEMATLGADDGERPEGNDLSRQIEETVPYFGDEVFFSVGQGMGEALGFATRTYRDTSAASLGLVARVALDSADAGKAFEPPEPDDEMVSEFIEKLHEALLKDSAFRLPPVIAGWKPHAEKLDECRETIDGLFAEMTADAPAMKAITFEASGVAMSGYEGGGRDLFADLIRDAREQLRESAAGTDAESMIPDERLEELVGALEDFRLTLACGVVDGYVVLYLGSGSEGFGLAENPDASLASRPALAWTNRMDEEKLTTFSYASESLVRAGLPLIDSGPYWEALADAAQAPGDRIRALRTMFSDLAETERQLAERQTADWSGVLLQDEGLRFESRGGWTNPGIDYQAPLQLTEAALATEPAIRAHWVQNRSRNDLEWLRIEQLAGLLELAFEFYRESGIAANPALAEDTAAKLTDIVRTFNGSYRDGFRGGIGDEVAVVADFHGMTPPVPGIPAEIVEQLETPRFLIARPVTDRAKLAESSEAFVRATHELAAMSGEAIGFELPHLVPQLVESNEFDTWYYPLPISGGDFIPGVSINDRLWMLGTSRSLAKAFANAPEASEASTGVVFDVDFTAIGHWLRSSHELVGDSTGNLDGMLPDSTKDFAKDADMESVSRQFGRLRAFRYRHWLENGAPRSSWHLEIAPAPEKPE